MDVDVALPVIGSITGGTPSGVVLGNPGMKHMQLEVSNAKNYIFRMAKPPVMYIPAAVMAESVLH